MSNSEAQVESEDENQDIDIEKAARIARSKAKLLENLNAGNFKQLTTRVAHILNIFPESRNSDITLALRYWETYQHDVFDGEHIGKKDLFKLERQVDITRARAKIQNEYKLFMAKDEIRRHRKKNEREMVESTINDQAATIKQTHVFSDESGKTQDFFVVGSIWVLEAKQLVFLTQKIEQWKVDNGLQGKEIHFKRIKNGDFNRFKSLVDLISANSSYLSFKSLTAKNSELKRSQAETLNKLHEIILHRGVVHEVESKRISGSSLVKVTLDDESSLDPVSLEELKHKVETKLAESAMNSVGLADITTVPSQRSIFIQIADLIASSIGRRLNNPDAETEKDKIANYLIDSLQLNLSKLSSSSDITIRFNLGN
ncbi:MULTISPECIES: DUF3800 domain-containing protein [Idiomarina]|uniref:DUF3800 domain-containing protein n=1 Tax=Idiomarina loihiensis (strain ATCC BAA-735 / DSM 15497 / L2-TR) TaxID=283942 RepID=Q5QUX2_IDILO|nr:MULTISPECIES: DUF3800 domain-containing protein [Idiomarina]MAC35048.1 DUF3800 domain-containing protein [Haliea sp.]AAV81488.1 Hypothetical protein IL0647 [Idiomarina loihiensis L2TR]AGM35515.1 hypothetical protein K734_03240 [Idiomarina loihiensis GSL 199]MAO68187.1 DUF3800 domain-containing protein [Idiomarina sp.]MBF79939.1 DUF3800 domain-containing protein [Idiomarina sp.]